MTELGQTFEIYRAENGEAFFDCIGDHCMTDFPGLGKTYLVDFVQWRTRLQFNSENSLTYTGVKHDGSLGASETVTVVIDPVRDNLFLVTWQEGDQTTVVHLEDYATMKIVTHITSPDGSFDIFHGTMTEIQSE